MIHKHKPVPEESMKWVSPQNTICETLRKIYTASNNEDVRLNARIATSMAKSMSSKLSEYRRTWRNGFFDDNHKFPVAVRSKPIDVLFLCWDDNANTMYRFWQCARHLGLNSVAFKWKTHSFGYPQQVPIYPVPSQLMQSSPTVIMAPGIESLVANSKVVHLFHSTWPMASVKWEKVNLVVQHGGTVYRQAPDSCNAIFNQFAKKAVIQCPDLLDLGAKNENWIYYPVDTMAIKPDFEPRETKPVIGHFPSNPVVKGSDAIIEVIKNLQHRFDFDYVGSKGVVPWSRNLERMAECDIIVEGCNANQGGKVYGEWGNTCLEASALGCSVVTHSIQNNAYLGEFGEFAPLVANNPNELRQRLCYLLSKPERIQEHKKKCREWVEEKHSIQATANRMWDLVYKEFF